MLVPFPVVFHGAFLRDQLYVLIGRPHHTVGAASAVKQELHAADRFADIAAAAIADTADRFIGEIRFQRSLFLHDPDGPADRRLHL